jgi:elongation factor P
MFESGDLRKGKKLEIDGEPYVVVQFAFVKPGFRSGEKFDEADLEEVEMEYLYAEGNQYCFMNTSNYEQEYLSEEQVAEAIDFLKENTVCSILMFAGRPIGISLPNFINLRVEKTDPWVKGDTASGDSKPATLETGYVLNVPPFIEEGQLLKIDTRSGQYVERVKE